MTTGEWTDGKWKIGQCSGRPETATILNKNCTFVASRLSIFVSPPQYSVTSVQSLKHIFILGPKTEPAQITSSSKLRALCQPADSLDRERDPQKNANLLETPKISTSSFMDNLVAGLEGLNINRLPPDELVSVFEFLQLHDLKNAMLVCRWILESGGHTTHTHHTQIPSHPTSKTNCFSCSPTQVLE